VLIVGNKRDALSASGKGGSRTADAVSDASLQAQFNSVHDFGLQAAFVVRARRCNCGEHQRPVSGAQKAHSRASSVRAMCMCV
jgi:hypothetical protein